MCYWLILESGIPILETTVQHVTWDDPETVKKVAGFNEALNECLDNTNFTLPLMDKIALKDVNLKDLSSVIQGWCKYPNQ